MAKQSSLVSHPLVPLLAFSLALSAMSAIYLFSGRSPSPAFEMTAALSWTVLLAFVIVADARRRDQVPCFDFCMYCYLFYPVAVPWYCIRSRGWRGILLLAAIVVLWLLPYLVGAVVWQTLYGGSIQ